MTTVQNNAPTYIPSAPRPVRFDTLWPGSYFTIVAEPSRGIRKSSDIRIYRKHLIGFYAEHPQTGLACCLMPQDIVQPMKRVNPKRTK